ncbi:MAG TPA: peptidoglycan bridge formation glycyltransferase FemA/FemB family protein [Anaerolineales bacterium]|nr:peptidoglycan bridge formation glycyltransferase FemA/FemB family protein [Anaerolineales bacterium]
MPLLSRSEWDAFLAAFPDAHLLQTTAWGELKAAFGWEVVRAEAESPEGRAGVQALFRRLAPGLTAAYIPKGPVGVGDLSGWERAWAALQPEVDRLCRRKRAVFLKVEPDIWEADQGAAVVPPPGFRLSAHAIQPPHTLVVDLTGSEEQVLARMKQKTRYNIRLAQKKGLVVRASADLEPFYRMLRTTGERDAFGIHSLEYYRKAYKLFHPIGTCELLIAEYEGEPLAGLMAFAQGRRAWYLYGASSDVHREWMPTYLVQWEAMRWARARGCQEYDLWGVPDAGEDALEAGFQGRSDGLWGVYRFKRGFGGHLRRAAGPWDRVYMPAVYRLYLLWARQWKLHPGTA